LSLVSLLASASFLHLVHVAQSAFLHKAKGLFSDSY